MFDETAEKMLHQTDLHHRLTEALDGENAWIKWDLARAIARNIKFKLEDPPLRPIPTKFLQRIHSGIMRLYQTFPEIPDEWHASERVDDPSLGWRGEKIMQRSDAALDIPGARRRILRWRSWWNKTELYPPSVDRWFGVRRSFFANEASHLAVKSSDAEAQLSEGIKAAREGAPVNRVLLHVWRGCALMWMKPIRWSDRT